MAGRKREEEEEREKEGRRRKGEKGSIGKKRIKLVLGREGNEVRRREKGD